MSRNLTYDGLLKWMQDLRDQEIAKIGEWETDVIYTPKLSAKGERVLDTDGVPVLVEKRVLKRDIAAMRWTEKLKPYEDQAHDRY